MIKANSTIHIDNVALENLTRASVVALEQTGSLLKGEVVQAQVVPFKGGTLQGEAFFVRRSELEEGKVSLVHTTPYARRLYFHPEYNFGKESNPNARGKWFEDWLPGGEKQKWAEKTFAELYRRIAKL